MLYKYEFIETQMNADFRKSGCCVMLENNIPYRKSAFIRVNLRFNNNPLNNHLIVMYCLYLFIIG